MPDQFTDISEQRWLDCVNVGTLQIPPHGVVQIVKDDPILPVGNRVVYRVRDPQDIYGVIDRNAPAANPGTVGYYIESDTIGFAGRQPIEPGAENVFTLDTPAIARTPSSIAQPDYLTANLLGGFALEDWSVTEGILGTAPFGSPTSFLSMFRFLGWLDASNSQAIVHRVKYDTFFD